MNKKRKKENLLKIEEIFKKKNNLFIDYKSKDIYYKKRSIGCTYCTMGKGCTIVLSYKCHRDCFFCYEETPLNPKNKIDPYNENDLKKIYKIIDESFSNPLNMTLSITGGEPLLFIDKVYEILEYVNKKYPGKHKRIYTTGDLLNENQLKDFRKLGLDEIRFSIKPGEIPNIDIYKLSKKYIKTVIIEILILPNSKDYLIDIFTKIDDEKCVDGINLNELTFNNLNTEKYKENNLKLDLPKNEGLIYQRYYDVAKIKIGIYGSKLLALELIDYFSDKNAGFFMHYCYLDTISTHHYIYKKNYANSLGIKYSQINKFGLHKVLRIYGNINKILFIITKNNIKDFYKNNNYVELSIDFLNYFNEEDIYNVIIYKNYDYKYDVDFELI